MVRRISNIFYWGLVLNNILANEELQPLLYNNRSIIMSNIIKEAIWYWGSKDNVYAISEVNIIQECTICVMIGN